MIDLRPIHHVVVDPSAQRARVGDSATPGELDSATQEHGCAVPAGTVSYTGVGGLTSGGGWGRLARLHGLTLDNLESAQVVLTDGRYVRSSATEYPDERGGRPDRTSCSCRWSAPSKEFPTTPPRSAAAGPCATRSPWKP
jgi:FAD/FMN-containing dehydrogenase